MTSDLNKLIEKLQKTNYYLDERSKQQPNYQQLISLISYAIAEINNYKIQIKFVGNSLKVTRILQNFIISKINLSSFYQITTIKLKQNLELLNNCDLVCLVYDQRSPSDLEKQLIEQANQNPCQQIILFDLSLIEQDNFSETSRLLTATKAERKDYSNNLLLKKEQLAEKINNWHNWVINDRQQLINILNLSLAFQKNIESIEEFIQINLELYYQTIHQELQQKLVNYFELEKKISWQKIYQQKNKFFQGEPPNLFKPKINQSIQKLNQEQQQVFKILKQKVNHYKLDLLNPFIPDSLIYQVQQTIEYSELSELKENNQTYLYLVIKEKEYYQRIHTYILNLCQESFTQWFEREWQSFNNFDYSNYLQELKFLSPLYQKEINHNYFNLPKFEINNFISIAIVEEIGKTKLDYHYTQSTWFRLIVAIFIGLIIFVVTGKLFGFVILIYQFINLITAKDAKTIRIKQQNKELKRIADGKYQSLVRLLSDRAGQTLIAAIEEASQQYQTELNEISSQAHQKYAEVKQTIDRNQNIINRLKQDQAEIEKLLLE